MRLHLCRVGGRTPAVEPKSDYETKPIRPFFSIKTRNGSQIPSALACGSTPPRSGCNILRIWDRVASGCTRITFRGQGGRRASVGGIWLSFSALVENKGSDWVRFVIRFWFVGVECRQMNIAAVCGRTFPQFRRSCCVLLHLCVAG